MWLYVVLIAALMNTQTSPVSRVVADNCLSKNAKRQQRIARLIHLYARNWHVNPLLMACVAASESNFRDNPPPLTYCHTEIQGGKAVQVCVRKKKEEGIMQSIPYLKVTKQGFWYCFGDSRAYSREALRRTDAGLCVGAFELSARRMWVRRWKRIRPRHDRHRRFLYDLRRKYPQRYNTLVEMFWTAATYNWGPRILNKNVGKYDPIGYPIRVMKCFLKYEETLHADRGSGKEAPGPSPGSVGTNKVPDRQAVSPGNNNVPNGGSGAGKHSGRGADRPGDGGVVGASN